MQGTHLAVIGFLCGVVAFAVSAPVSAGAIPKVAADLRGAPLDTPLPPRITLAQATQDAKALATAVQLELNRLGCDAGTPDGIWGRGSRRALEMYGEKTGASDLPGEPTETLLDLLRGENGRLCTLPPGVVAAEDRSETSHLEAVKYSYKVWSSMPSKVATEATEYGVLRCEAGRGSTPRTCVWQ